MAAAIPLVRRSIRALSHNARLARALKQVTPPTWTQRDYSSSPSRQAKNEPSDEFPGATTGVPSASEMSKSDIEAEMRKIEQSLGLAGIQQQGDEPSIKPQQTDDLQPQEQPPTPPPPPPPKRHRVVLLEQHLGVGDGLHSGRIKPARPHNRARPHIAPNAREYLRFARIFNLAPTTTLADVLAGLAATAPVGRVLDIAWDKGGRLLPYKGREVRAALVLFDHEAAVVDLVRLATQKRSSGGGEEGAGVGFRVRGERPHVSLWTQRAFNGNVDAAEHSRVVVMRGPRDVPDFSEEDMRRILLENAQVVKALGPLGLDAEEVVTTDWGAGQRVMEWRFYSNQRQARPVLAIMRRHFHRELQIDYGPDPCWNEREYPRQRTSTRDTRHLTGLAETKAVLKPRKRYSRGEDNTLAPRKITRSANGDEEEGHDARYDPYSDYEASEEEFQVHWEDANPNYLTRAPAPERPLEPIDWEALKYDPKAKHTTDDDTWGEGEDEIPFEGEEDPFAEMRKAAHEDKFESKPKAKPKAKPEARPKALASSQKRRVSEWMRLQNMIASRGRRPPRV